MITRRLPRASGLLTSNGWMCPSCRHSAPTAFRQRLFPASTRRSKHSIAHHDSHAKFLQDGVPGLFSEKGYQIAWLETQTYYINRLNELVAGTEYENATTKDLVIRFARDPMMAPVFNHASMAWNNHFFISKLSLSPRTLDQQQMLKNSLVRTFGSMETLRATMLDTAAAMFGPGFVWLVYCRNLKPPGGPTVEKKGQWRILPTYLAGTPWPEAGYRQQGIDMNTSNADGVKAYQSGQISNAVGVMGPYSAAGQEQGRIPPGGTFVEPVLCVNTWQSTYLYDFGVSGKRKYLNDWWDSVDWAAVDAATPNEAYTMPMQYERDRGRR